MKIIITDWTDYDPQNSATGGRYWFSTVYEFIDGEIRRHYNTSAEATWCWCYGRFGHSEECNECSGYIVTSIDDVIENLQFAKNKKNYTIKVQFNAKEAPRLFLDEKIEELIENLKKFQAI
ncbi:MAG: hypothetical protein CH6_0047 [Candidatus Kapaibacterium sp.]|nr:MAG: hypothetical protein CH6_0047 [Candidatus Kapabacteria bacterium]